MTDTDTDRKGFHCEDLTPAFLQMRDDVPPQDLTPEEAPKKTAINWATCRRLDVPEVQESGYALREDIYAALVKLADDDCYQCHGTGVSSWRLAGRCARMCRCVRDNHSMSDEARPS